MSQRRTRLTMKTPAALAALIIAVASAAGPALARTSYVTDDAHMLSSAAIAQIDSQVGDFNAQTGKEVVVVTTPSLDGTSPDTAIERSFAQQQVNGVEIFIAKNEHVIRIAGDRASSQFFPSGSYQAIAKSMRDSFRAGNFDGGVENAVNLIINTYRGHESSLNRARHPVSNGAPAYVRTTSGGGFHMGWILWIIVLAVIFFIIRGIFRALSGPRYYGGGPGMGGPGYGGPGYGGPGYGGYGYGGGGGGFWSGLLGGLGGAWLGNEMFGGNRTTVIDNTGVGGVGGDVGGADASGWQNDAGQIDTSNIGGASWGDGGGDAGGGGGWGGGDGGGWGGGDSGGGGGGDSGGGW